MFLMFQSFLPPLWVLWIVTSCVNHCTFLNCTTQVHSWPVNGHTSYQVPQFILPYSSGCGSVRFQPSWPCDTQDLNLRLCQSRELPETYVSGRRKAGMCGVQVAQDNIAQGLCIPLAWGSCCASGSCILSSLLQLLPRANVCHPLCVQDVPSHSHVPVIQFGQISDALLGMSQQEL